MTITINGTTGISGVDGTASTPAIQGNDTNTGMFFPAADTIAFAEGGTEVARFDSSGNLGIGTSSPAGRLEVANITGGGGFGFLIGFGANGDNYYTSGSNGIHVFRNSSSERMRIDTSGNLLVNRTSAYSDGSMGAPLIQCGGINGVKSGAAFIQNSTASTGAIGFANPNGYCGGISTSGTSTTYATSSDYRLKENIAPMTGALGVVQQLKPVTYTWKIDGSSGQGFIAHELQTVVPDCVTGEKDAVDAEGKPIYQGIDTSFLVATLTAAIQELKAELDTVKTELATLKGASNGAA